MYELLIPRVIGAFSKPQEPERVFLKRVQKADVRMRQNYKSQQTIGSAIYEDPSVRAAYLLGYLGHYSLQLGDVLTALDGQPEAAAVLCQPHLRVAALCGGPAPEAIALAALHSQLRGESLEVTVFDRNALHWQDCWPISQEVANHYPTHPQVRISGQSVDLVATPMGPKERAVLGRCQVLTAMNCLNELYGLGVEHLRRALAERLDVLPPGALVLASDQANYPDCERGLAVLHELLQERQAKVHLADLKRSEAHVVANRFGLPERISWMYGPENENNFRVWVRQLRLAACLP
ncbi:MULTISPECIES: hypothetical protein [unclassified Synechococcus]|uniref:hypothetical protein n=1 Tax=unclassified Synechococcus TaxID=2626047 RepID=UPI0021A88796|nr:MULTISPECIES: hypothetical protein [unclassified Synechococcus]MCT0212427.1 hypothetical protein [Synechococcus sp. CS-1326]MCT0234610.1 hypothetical protein [Synechococcus sp. CS-1327]